MNNIDNLKLIKQMLSDIESDHVERTVSTTNTDKFGQAICAFANDLPNRRAPGYLLIGVKDDGSLSGLKATDALLKNIAAIRTDGNIQPQPSMTVEKVTFPEGDVVVVEVQPAVFPPVRYKGRVWIRVGPRRAIANEADEHLLLERRSANVQTFDATPCFGATIADLDLKLFKHYYLPKAVPDEVTERDMRSVDEQMQALGFYDLKFNCPTYAGILFFGNNVERFLGGAYVQYVRFSGGGRTGEILNEHKFSGNLCTILSELDVFIRTTVSNRRPIPVSALREETVVDYPHWATRELLMNAICHRDYTGNGPVQFYQYDNRIEILNPGGLYGKANAGNFPKVNDYRNLIVAEGMRVLGFVNRFSRGVLQVEDSLEENGNGLPVFDLELDSAFLVTEYKSNRGEILEKKAIEQGLILKEDLTYGESQSDKTGQNRTKPDKTRQNRTKPDKTGQNRTKPDAVFKTQFIRDVYNAIKMNPKAKYAWLESYLGVDERTISRAVKELKIMGYIHPEHPKMGGEWQLLK